MSTILECSGLFKNYAQTPALMGINLKVEAGGVVGLLGPNGSGKSTFIKLAMGMLQPTEGHIYIDGKEPCPATKEITAYLPDKDFLPSWMRVEQAVKYFEDFFSNFRRDKAEAIVQLPMFLLVAFSILASGQFFTSHRKGMTSLVAVIFIIVVTMLDTLVVTPISTSLVLISPHLEVWISIAVSLAIDVGCTFFIRYILKNKVNLIA